MPLYSALVRLHFGLPCPGWFVPAQEPGDHPAEVPPRQTMGTSCFREKSGVAIRKIENNFNELRPVKQWNRLPREMVESLLLQVLKAELDRALGNII